MSSGPLYFSRFTGSRITSFESGFKSTTRKDSTRNGYREISTGIFPATLRPYASVEISKLTKPSTAVVAADTTTFIATVSFPLEGDST